MDIGQRRKRGVDAQAMKKTNRLRGLIGMIYSLRPPAIAPTLELYGGDLAADESEEVEGADALDGAAGTKGVDVREVGGDGGMAMTARARGNT